MQAVAQRVSAKPAVAARPARSAVVVRAAAESRRAVLGGLLAGAALTVAKGAEAAASAVDLFDDRKAKATGYDLIYEARELELDQATRDGLTQARSDLAGTKARVKKAEAQIDSLVEGFIRKNYWVEAREQLRRQVGTLRFDLNTLAEAKGKEGKKAALALKKDFISKVEDLDFSLREKDEASALKKLEASKKALDTVLAAVL